MQFPFINLAAQYQAYKTEIDSAIHAVLDSTTFIGGEQVSTLETELAHYCGSKHAIGCSSGTDALLLALLALRVQPGDEIIVPSFTFVATAEVVALLGCKPVFADVRQDDALIDVQSVASQITNKTRAIIPVGLFGQCPDMDAIQKLADTHQIDVIEDAAQSFGATYKNSHSCNLGRLACTSFFPAKPLGCYGDGGAVFTTDDSLAQRMKELRNHGQSAAYQYSSIGINGRLDAMQAAILRVKLRHFDKELRIRQHKAQIYDKELTQSVRRVHMHKDRVSNYAHYTVFTEQRDKLHQYLGEAQIPTAIYYPKPLHTQKTFQQFTRCALPVTDTLAQHILSLPMSPFLQEDEQRKVIDTVNSFFA